MSRVSVWAPSFDPTQGGIEALSVCVRDACRGIGAAREVSLGRPSGPGKVAFAARCLLDCVLGRPQAVVLMHLHFVPLAAAMKRVFRFRLAVWLHGIEAWDGPARRHLRGLESVDLWIASSAVTKARTAAWRESRVRCEVVHPAVDFRRFSPGPPRADLAARHGLSPADEVVLTVGRLAAGEGYKGHDAVIRALPRVLAVRPGVVYLVVGDGDDRVRLEQLTADAGLAKRVVFAGRVPADELPDHYRLATVFAMPSGGEGFGIVYLEALGCGCRIVAGFGDGAADALAGGRLGTMVDPTDVSALSDALIQALAAGRHFTPPAALGEFFGMERFEREIAACLGNLLEPCAE